MSQQNVNEHQIASLLKDFTRAALLAQPPNLVEFAQQYFNALNPSEYAPITPQLNSSITKNEPENEVEEISPTMLYEVHSKLNELNTDQLQDFATVKAVFDSVGVWNSQIEQYLKEKSGELSRNLLFQFACSLHIDGRMKSFVESLKTVFEVCGDQNGMSVQEVIDVVADLVMVHDDIDQVLADQLVQFLLGQGFMESDAEVTSKFDGATYVTIESLLSAPCLQHLLPVSM